MTCSACGHEPPAGSTFCNGCGAKLEVVCGSCGATPPPDSKFCNGCGAALGGSPPPRAPVQSEETRSPADYTPRHLADRILQSKSALEGERKQVTVMFADVKGSMELAEQVDPEEWHRILDRFFQILSEGVHRFEGTVNQYTGDGIMALFGAPISHEDHAQRACFAALHLKKALREYADELRRTQGLSFSTRIGINSGTVVVGKIGDDLRMDYTAQGQTVGLAQRMEALAEPGCAYLAEGTRGLVEGYFALRPLGEFSVKGVSEPVSVHELEGLGSQRTRLDRSRARGFSRFVGRRSELDMLEYSLEQSLSGRGRVVGVVAEAGTGKSRLCDEFIARCRERGLRVIAGHCPAHGQSVPFLPMLELLRNVFGIEEQDDDLEARRKVAGELTLLDSELQSMIPVLFEFLGIPDPERPAQTLDSAEREKKLLAFIAELVQARSAREPGMIFVDDLHWVDPGSEAFIAQLVEVAASTRTLVLLNFRPEYRAEWMQKYHYHQVPLDPLGAEEVEELVTDLLGTHASLDGLSSYVFGRTGGNPFFVEEIIQSLVESGSLEGERGAYRMTGSLDDLEIPPSVHAVLAARIDRLNERDKRLLQVASAIGRKVPEPLLAEVADLPDVELAEALANLQRGEFLLQQVMYPEAEYMFKHALTLDVAYESQLAQTRERLHAAVARATEARAGDKLDEQAGLLAHHWESAGEAVTAARWHVRASRVAGLTRATELVRHLRKALGLLDGVAEDEAALALSAEALSLLLVSGVRAGGMEDAELLVERAGAIARTSSDPLVKARIAYGVGSHLVFSGRAPSAGETLRDARSFAETSGDVDLQIGSAFTSGVCQWFTGSVPEALETMNAGFEMVSRAPGHGSTTIGYDSEAAFVCFQGLYETMMGNARKGMALLDRSLERARSCDAASRILAYAWAAWAAALEGDSARSLAMGQRSFELMEQVSAQNIQGIAMVGYAHSLVANGQWQAALELYDRVRANAPPYMRDIPGRARALLELGRAQDALVDCEETTARCAESGQLGWECWSQVDLVEVLSRQPAAPGDRIDQEFERARQRIDETGQLIFRPRLHEIRARLDPARREAELREAHRLYAELGCSHADRLRAELEA